MRAVTPILLHAFSAVSQLNMSLWLITNASVGLRLFKKVLKNFNFFKFKVYLPRPADNKKQLFSALFSFISLELYF
jgi:hypothetical protein